MGAVVGALYASGYSGRELDSLARVVPLAALFRTYQPLAPRSLGILQPLVVWEQGDRGFALQSASVVEAEANALVNAAMLRGNLLARGDFDSLPIPFRAVATDLAHRETVVLSLGRSGPGGARERRGASPVRARSGGTAGSSPTAGSRPTSPSRSARAEGAERVIVVDATEHPPDSVSAILAAARRRPAGAVSLPAAADSLRPGRPPHSARRRRVRQSQLLPPRTSSACSTEASQAADRVPAPDRVCREPLDHRPGMPTEAGRRRCRSANASEQLALARLLARPRQATATRSTTSFCCSRVRTLAAAPRHTNPSGSGPPARGDSVRLGLTLRRAARARRRARPRLRQRARRAHVGRCGGSAAPRPRARGECRGLPRRVSARALRSDFAATFRWAASSSIRRSRFGWPTRMSDVRFGGRRARLPRIRGRRSDSRGSSAHCRGLGRGPRRGRPHVGRARPPDRSTIGGVVAPDRRQPPARARAAGRGAVDRHVPAHRGRRHLALQGSGWSALPLGCGSAGATDYRCSSGSPSAGTTAFRATIWESVAAIARR